MKKLTTFALMVATSSMLSFGALAGTPTVSESGQFEQKTGEELYSSICQGCHMPDGKGVNTGAGFYPALAGNLKLSSAGYPIYVLTHGFGGMPNFKDYLSDEQIVEVVNYVRTHFGNNYTDKATIENVQAVLKR